MTGAHPGPAPLGPAPQGQPVPSCTRRPPLASQTVNSPCAASQLRLLTCSPLYPAHEPPEPSSRLLASFRLTAQVPNAAPAVSDEEAAGPKQTHCQAPAPLNWWVFSPKGVGPTEGQLTRHPRRRCWVGRRSPVLILPLHSLPLTAGLALPGRQVCPALSSACTGAASTRPRGPDWSAHKEGHGLTPAANSWPGWRDTAGLLVGPVCPWAGRV